MIVLQPDSNSLTPNSQTILLIGKGLIGSACAAAWQASGYKITTSTKMPWGDAKNLKISLNQIFEDLPNSSSTIRCVWAAGKAGFNASMEETNKELADFEFITSTIHKNCQHRGIASEMYLLSSAGGLFEGEKLVRESSPPQPKRPYGHLKLAQENFAKILNFDKLRIFRPSSVFGGISREHRMGLIPNLVKNGAIGNLSYIFGGPDTLRDYVYVEDVARAINYSLHEVNGPKIDTEILCSGKPSSLFEIQRCIEVILNKKIFITYVASDNNDPITYMPCRLAFTYTGGGVREKIKRVYETWER